MSDARIKIRCPNCMKHGRARAEVANRRVSCKHCQFVFRATPVDDDPAPAARIPEETTPRATGSAASGRHEARGRIEGLEQELERLRDDLATQSAEPPAPGQAEFEAIRAQLRRAQEDARKAEAQLREVETARTRIEQVLSREAEAARAELDRAREDARQAAQAHAEKERAMLGEIDGLRDQVDQTVMAIPEPDLGRHFEDEVRILREDLAQARDAAEAEARGRREADGALAARQAEHAEALREAREQLDRARADAEAARAGLEENHDGQIRALRADLEAAHGDRDRVDSERSTAVGEIQRLLDQAPGEFGATREHRDRLAADLDALGGRLDESEWLRAESAARAAEQATEHERARADLEAEVRGLRHQREAAGAGLDDPEATRRELEEARELTERLATEVDRLRAQLAEARDRADLATARAEAGMAVEADQLRVQLAQAQAGLREAEAIRRGRDVALAERDQLVDELRRHRSRPGDPDQTETDWGFLDPEDELSEEQDARDEDRAQLAAEAESLRAELAGARADIGRQADELAELTRGRDQAVQAAHQEGRAQAERDGFAAETEALRHSLVEALKAAEAAARINADLAERVRQLEQAPTVSLTPAEDPVAVEAARRSAVDEAVKGAWADFERRLAETQGKLKAANARAELLEAAARQASQAREPIAGAPKDPGPGEVSSSEDSASLTSLRILSDRGAARLTLADAEARLALARQLAVERKDRGLIDRIAKMAGKVRDDLKAGNFTLAETLVRGAEIEVGLDPGGYSIGGLKIFRPSPSIVNSLAALTPALERVMKLGDLASIRSTLGEIRTILGDQAGLPEIRRPGRNPVRKSPVDPAEAVRLFLGALEAEQWLIRPILARKPPPETALATYAALVEACAEARPAAQRHAPDRVELLDQVIPACAAMLVRRQQPDGHFPYLDPRGRPSRLASTVEAMVAQNPAAVKDGWVIAADPAGTAQVETGSCGVALLRAAAAVGRAEWIQAALKAADWAAGQPCLPHFAANAASASLLARAYLQAPQDRHLAGLVTKLEIGLLPGQVDNGRWVDAATAQTPHHLAILRALHDAWEALPADRADLRAELKASLDRAADSLLGECQVLGVPAQGGALRDLVRHRDLTRPATDPRLAPAILDSATVVQELCHDGARPRLGVPPDQLAALLRA